MEIVGSVAVIGEGVYFVVGRTTVGTTIDEGVWMVTVCPMVAKMVEASREVTVMVTSLLMRIGEMMTAVETVSVVTSLLISVGDTNTEVAAHSVTYWVVKDPMLNAMLSVALSIGWYWTGQLLNWRNGKEIIEIEM